MPICGLEKGLEQNLRSILEQDYPAPHQVVLSAQREDEPALPLLRRLAEEYGPETGASAFCLGSSVAFRRSTLEAIGGLEPLAEFLVEDFEMGRRMRALGLRLALVRRPVDSIIDLASARAWWQHQIYFDFHLLADERADALRHLEHGDLARAFEIVGLVRGRVVHREEVGVGEVAHIHELPVLVALAGHGERLPAQRLAQEDRDQGLLTHARPGGDPVAQDGERQLVGSW